MDIVILSRQRLVEVHRGSSLTLLGVVLQEGVPILITAIDPGGDLVLIQEEALLPFGLGHRPMHE